MNSFYPLMQQQPRFNPGVILNPLAAAAPPPVRTSEVLAAAVRSFLTQAIDEPSETYEHTGFSVLKDYPEEVVYIGYTLLKAYLTDKLLSVPAVSAVVPGIEIKPLSFIGSGDRWAEVWRNIGTSVTSKSRLTKAKGGYTLSLYVGSVNIGYYNLLDLAQYASTIYNKTGRYLGWDEQRTLNSSLETALQNAKATVFGKDLLDLSKSADFTIKVANPFAHVSRADFLSAEMSDEESLDAFGLLFKGFRIISPQLAGGSSANYNLFKTNDGAQHYTPDEIPAEEMSDYIKHAIYRRELEGFVNFHIPQDIAEYVTQSEGDKATKGKLGMWFFQWSANCMHPNGSGAFSEIINPLSGIAEINAPNESKAAPKSNEHNLAIDNSGHIVYLPTVNKAKEYDALYDSIGSTEDGDWCVNDIKELPGNTAPLTGPRTRSEIVSRKFPENMLIYTDWINGKLSYSNTAGVLQILDIDSYSPASATTIRALLDTPLFGNSVRTRSMLAAVTAFIRQYAPDAMYAHLQSNQWADFKAVFGDWKKDNPTIDEEDAPPYYIASMASQIMGSALPAFLDNLYWRMRAVSNEIERNPENNSGANATLLLDYAETEEWTVKEFSMSSSLPILHCVGYALKMALENALSGDADTLTERLFTGKSVLSNMSDLGITVGIAQYVNDYEGVAIQDRANRKIYMEAKRDSKYIPKPVPLVKDRYFLPHQAKNAAILDQKPKNAILSVSAGGGKCQVGETLVPTSKGLLRLDEIWEKSKGPIDENGFKPFVSTVISHKNDLIKTDKVYATEGKTWRVTFSDGTIVEGLPEHKYWAYRDDEFQFVRLDELEAGDCAPKSLGTNLYGNCSIVPGTDIPLGKDLAFILGYMVAEGYFGGNVDKRSMAFSNHDPSIIKHFNGCWNRVFGHRLGFVIEPRLNNKVTGLWITEQSEKDLLWNLCGRGTSDARYVPQCIRMAPKVIQAAFLSALFEGDGSIYESTECGKTKGNWTIEYTTISKDLANQTRYMLENMGILTILKEIDTWASNGSENQVSKRGYTIYLSHNSDAFSIFSENIGFIGANKTNRLKQCLAHRAGLVYGQDTNRNVFGAANNFPCGLHAERCLSAILSTVSAMTYADKRGVIRHCGRNTLTKLGFKTSCRASLNKNGYTSRHWLNLLRAIICDTPKEISTSLKSNKQIRSSWERIKQVRDYVWVSVVSVEETGVEKPVYDISVPGPNSYASNGLYSHNTIQLIVDMLRNLGDGSSKRPLVLCPGFLVKNYVEDIAYFTEGRLNAIVVNSETMRVYGEEKLRAMIKSAPPNTVVLSDYDFISRGRTSAVPYGMNSINISQNAEFLREFDFSSCALDESHNLKNADSLRSQFTQRIINTIPMRRLATGTFTPNQTSDIIGQMNMLDPSIFGDLDDFIEEYSNGKVGNVFLWKDGAEKEVARRISENSALITCKRKEWQFLLPLKEEKFHFIDLTKAQRAVYDAILEEEIERIKENEKLRKKLESGDENDAEAIETMLKAYLQRVERFLAAPATDELGNRLLEGDDRISPKGLEVARLFEEHLASGDTGKILVFTSYLPSAQAIYDCLSPTLQAQTLHYTSANKANDLATFNKDPRIKFLVGVENSLKEGLNLQIASRLIRVETVWSPGALEQAESRINRPDPKNNDPSKQRAKIFLDWLVVDRTIDVTKTARLISKMIKTTKFEEQNNRIYDQVPDDLDPILMTLDNITNLNSWEEHLSDYLRGYNSLKSAEKQDYDAYRANPEFSTANVPLAEGSTIQGASIMPQVPYIEAMTLPHTEELGLKSFADYVSEHSEPIDDAYKYFDASGLRVHTEYGDGVITYSAREASLSISVLLDNGNKVSVKKLKTFIITEEKKGGVRQRLAAIANLPLRSAVKKAVAPPVQQPVVTPPKVDTGGGGGRREPVPNVDTQANAKFNLYLCVVNNMASVGIDDADPDVPVATLKKLGFAFSGSYVYCAIPTARSMHTFLAKLSDEYVVPQANMTVLENLAETFTLGRKKLLNVQQASAIEIQNFWRIAKRPVPKGTIKPYPIVQDGVLYIAFWKVGQPSVSTLKTKMAGIPGVTFNESDGEYFAFFPNKAQLKDFIKGLRAEGYSIGNMDEVKEQFTAIALSRVRAAAAK